jgi:hypothetical protein
MSVNRKRTEACCIRCHNARPSRFGRWCDKCLQQLTHEERRAAAELAILEDDDDPRLAPPRLATREERRNGHSSRRWKIIVDGADRRWYWEARGYTQSTLATVPFRSHIYYREVPEDEAR